MARSLKVLIVEDSAADAELCLRELIRSGFEVSSRCVDTVNDYLNALRTEDWQIVLSDYTMPQLSGLEALRLLRESKQDIPFIFVTGTINEEAAVECLKRGADDYILKDKLTRLASAVEQAIDAFENRRERARLEEQLRHAQRLEMIGTLAGGVAHDFSNLLTAIAGSADLLKSEIPDNERARKALETIDRAVEQASGVTSALLTFSHRMPTEKRPLDMRLVLDEAGALLRRMLPASVQVKLEVAHDEPLGVNADQVQLQQLIMNLAINARDAMKQGGTLTLRLSADQATSALLEPNTLEPGAPVVRLTVGDTGVGMTPEVQARMLEPFFTTKPRGEGTGLGLAIVHGVVKNHGGAISVRSEVGRGTDVSVFLPRVQPLERARGRSGASSSREGRGELVLVAEDRQYVREILAAMLKAEGYEVVAVADGPAILNGYSRHHRDLRLMILDMDLPGMNGVDCLQRLRTQGCEIPVIIITGSTNFDIKKVAEQNATLLCKPFRMAELGELAANLLHRQALQSTEP